MARQLSSKKPKRLGYTVGRLLGYMGHYKLLFFAVALLVTVSAVANLAGTYMIRPVVNSLDGGTWQEFVSGVVLTACVYGVGVLCALGYTQCMVSVAQKALYDIRRDLFAHLQDLPLVWFDGRNCGDVMSYFTNDVDTIADALNNSFAMVIQSFIQMTGTLVMLFVLNWKLSLIVAVCCAAMFLHIRYSGRRSKAYYNKQQACLGELDGYIEEMVNGQKVVKVFNHEDAGIETFVAKNRALQKAGTGAQSYAATMIPAVVSISYVNYAIVAVLGGIMALRGTMDAGSLASYLVFVRQAAAPINQFTQQSNFLLAALAGAERVFEVMDEKPETDEGGTVLVNVEAGADGALRETEHKTGRWAWRAPDGTLTPLRGDIRFGKLDATQEEIEAAAKIANADSFIRRLPKGYDTMVTSDGANLSQGQRQLLAIARAAVADPPVLILDEATSSVDTRTEALIEKGMDRLMEGRTVFVIAHRLSTVRNANAIMVLEHGEIVERGDHDDLLAQKGLYYKLYNGMFELS